MRATLNLIETVRKSADPLAVLTARAEARAYLWAEGEIAELADAVDPLQLAAERDGLVQRLGQDRVQAILAAAFRKVRKPFIVEIAERVPVPMPEAPVRGAAAATVDALMFSLRERGVAALAERDTLRRLAELSTGQVRNVIARLIVLRPRYPAVTDDLILKLGRLR